MLPGTMYEKTSTIHDELSVSTSSFALDSQETYKVLCSFDLLQWFLESLVQQLDGIPPVSRTVLPSKNGGYFNDVIKCHTLSRTWCLVSSKYRKSKVF